MHIRAHAVLSLVLLLFALPLQAATFKTGAPSTTSNDDSCDIGVFPAATLLLPYFEVDVLSSGKGTTVFSITNTGRLPQAVRVTLWTDRGYPVMSFPLYLTGYDLQVINLYDVIVRGRIGPEEGMGADASAVGEFSRKQNGSSFDNPSMNASTCTNMAVQLPSVLIHLLLSAFTTGRIPAVGTAPGCDTVGGQYASAVGYATVDVVGSCGTTLPTQPAYFASEIRHDNVLTGDYQQIDAANNFAQGGPLVHIRSIEERIGFRSWPPNFPRTFYSHLQPESSRTFDRRQPLPSTFAVRWIEGGSTGFETFYKIWRQVETAANASCSQYIANRNMPFVDVVRFDEEENVETGECAVFCEPHSPIEPGLPATSLLDASTTSTIPANTFGAVAGWIYFNLHNKRAGAASQAWVIASMRSEGRFSVDVDAVSLGNGCTPATPATTGGRP